jgi:hypothetical protein
MSEKLTSALGYLRGMADIGNPTEFVMDQIELADYLTMGHNICIDRFLNINVHLV